MPKTNEIMLKVFMPSKTDFFKYLNQFVVIRHKFEEDLVPKDYGEPFTAYGHNYALRSIDEKSTDKFLAAHDHVSRLYNISCRVDEKGFVAGIMLPYDKNASYLKNIEKCTVTRSVDMTKYWPLMADCGDWQTISADLSLITFGGRKYICANYNDCLSGNANVMECFSLNYLGVVPKFENNDYGANKKVLQELQDRVLCKCTDAEREALIEIKLSSRDNYESVEICNQPAFGQ